MNDRDLEIRLKSIRVPCKTEEYWDDFPSRVRVQLNRPVSIPPAQISVLRWGSEWSVGLALALVISILSVAPVFYAALKDETALRRDAERFPQKVHLLMADQHGMQYLIADRE